MSSHNNSAVAPTQHSSAVTPKTDHAKRVKRFGPQEVTPEMVAKLKRSVKATKKQSCLASIMHPDPRITDLDREHNEVIRREYNLIKSSYIRQQTRRGYGCVGYVPKGRCEVIGGKIRQFFLATCEHPRFDQFIMVCILVNCVFLALTDPTVETEPQYQEYAGYVFLFIFTVECMCKLIALSSLYFDDYWNWLDVVVVIEGWVSFISAGGGYLSGLKTLRILRPLRVANRLPALKKVITALLGSLPAIFNTFVVFFFFLLIFAMLCVMLWNGTFHYRCKNIETLEWVDEEALCYPAQPRADAMFCRSLQFLDSPYTCEDGERCEAYTATPENGDLNFDNLGYSLLTLFAVSTMEGWSDVLFYTQDVMTQGTFFVFLAIILIGNFTIVNLMIAAILVQLDGAAELEEREAVAAELAAAEEEEMALIEAEEARKKLIANAQEDARRRSVQGQKSVSIEIPPPVTSASLKRGRNNSHLLDLFCDTSSHILMNVCYQGIPSNLGPDHWTTKLRWIFLEDASPFSNFIQGCILFNLGVLAMDSHGITKSTATFLSRANLSLTGIFCFEMVAKLFTGGIPGYVSSKWNLFDGFIVIGSVLELAMASGASSLGALRVVRMLRLTRVARLARLANKWKSLQDVLKLIKKSSSGVGPVLLLLTLFMFIFSILGMQMFGKTVTSDEFIRFDSFIKAFVQCFYVITGEAWVDIMYVSMADAGILSFIYFVILIIIGCFILVNLVLAVILGDSMVPNTVGYQAGLVQLDATLESYGVRCCIARWKWSTDQIRFADMKRQSLASWSQSIELHGIEKVTSLASGLGMSQHFINGITRQLNKLQYPSPQRTLFPVSSILPRISSALGSDEKDTLEGDDGDDGGDGSDIQGSHDTLATPASDPGSSQPLFDLSSPSHQTNKNAKDKDTIPDQSTSAPASSSGVSRVRFSGDAGGGVAGAGGTDLDCSGQSDQEEGTESPEECPEEFDEKTWDKLRAVSGVIDSFATASLPSSWTEEIDPETKTIKYKDKESGVLLNHDAHPDHANFKAELQAIIHGKAKLKLISRVNSVIKMDNTIDQAFNEYREGLVERNDDHLTRSERKKHLIKKLGIAKVVIASVDAFEFMEKRSAGGWELKMIQFRKISVLIVTSSRWRDLIMAAIIVSSLMMVLQDDDTNYLGVFFLIETLCGIIFFVEVILMCGALESVRENDKNILGFRAYIEDPWNKLDLAIVISTFLAPIFNEYDIKNGYWLCTVVRAFRPLKAINRVNSLKSTVHLLYKSMIRLGTLGMFITFAFVAYAVVGMQLLKGLYYYCDDGDMADNDEYLNTVGSFPHNSHKNGKIDEETGYYVTRPCHGIYLNSNGTELEALGEWRNPTFHFDDFFNSFLTVFVLSTEGWAEIVWVGLSTTNVDYSQSPYYNTNILILWYFFFGVSFFALYMINLFIGVVFDLYIEMKNLEDDGKFKKREERSWAEYLSRLQQVKCLKKIPLPSTKWRMKIESFVTTDKFSKFIIGVIILNAITLVVIHRGQSEAFTNTLEWINVALAMIFVLEAILKLIGHGFTAYFSDSVDVFDFVVSVVSMIDSLLFITQTCAKSDSAFLRLVRSMRVFRLLRLVNLFRGCEDILLACKFALPKLIMVCSLLLILVFFFANIGWVLFHDFQEHGNSFSNFRTVFGAMQLLFVIMTGDAWTDTMGELVDDKPHFKIVVVIYFISYLIVQYFVVVNLFVMVVCEAFEVLSEGNRTAVERVLPVFQKVWTDYDPEATGFIHESELETLLRQIPEPIGVSFQATYTRLRTKADFLRMSLVKDKAPFTEVLTGLVAIWLTEEGQAVDTEIANQMNQLSASIVINAATRRWIQKREIRLKKIKLNEEMETEKMKREDNRFTLLLKKATNLALIGVSGKKHLEPLSKTPTLLPTTPLVDPLGVLPSSTSSSFSNKVNYNNIPSLIGGSLDNGIIPNNTTNSIEPSPSVSKDIENNSFSASSAASGSNSKSSLVSKGSWMTGSAKTSSALYSKGVRVAPLTHNSQEAPATQLPALKDTAAKTNNHHTIEVLDHNDENRKKNIIKDGKEETQEPVLASSIKNPKEETKEYVRSESPIDNALTSFIDPTAKTQKM
mmetsp:Transcript_1007/g.1240  ORF Transcript_1007/g.1240 Transcript_1007/m.1240 type:complete len:2098 (-) Transcript_1007:185-6478(-)